MGMPPATNSCTTSAGRRGFFPRIASSPRVGVESIRLTVLAKARPARAVVVAFLAQVLKGEINVQHLAYELEHHVFQETKKNETYVIPGFLVSKARKKMATTAATRRGQRGRSSWL